MTRIISIDPGTKKCGLLLADINQKIVLGASVTPMYNVCKVLKEWGEFNSLEVIIIGDGTNSKYWINEKNKWVLANSR